MLRGSLVAAAIALLAAAPARAATASEAVDFLNQQRGANLLPAVQLDDYRTTGCRNHNHYMAQNGGLQHGEEQGKPGYTPEGADYSDSGEVLAQGGPGWSAGSNPWDDAPLHQTLLFDPSVNRAGYDESEGFACMRFGFDFTAPPEPALYAFTGDGGRADVPRRVIVQGEGPYAPQEAVGIPQGVPTGPNILFFVEGFGARNHAVASSVTGPGGPVEVRMVDSRTQAPDGSGSPVFETGGDLIPVDPLEPLADYAVAVTWERDDTGEQREQTLTFRTAGRLVTRKIYLSPRLSRRRRAGLEVPTAAVGHVANLSVGRARSQIVLKQRQSIRVPRPPRGHRITVTVSVPPFVDGDARYELRRAKRRYR